LVVVTFSQSEVLCDFTKISVTVKGRKPFFYTFFFQLCSKNAKGVVKRKGIFTKNGRKMRQKWQQLGVCEFFFFSSCE